MAKKSYVGNPSNYAKLIPNIGYVGDAQNKSKRLLKGYIGNEQNLAKLFWEYVTGIVKDVFTKQGFITKDFTLYEAISPWATITNNTKYGDFTVDNVDDKLLIDNIFNYYNKVESKNNVITSSNSIRYNNYYEESITCYELFVPAATFDFVYIPTQIFGLKQLVFDVVSADRGLITVGACSRTSDDEAQAPTKYLAYGAVDNSSARITLNLNDIKADYIVFGVDEVQGLTTSFSVKKITATYERTYGIVYANSQAYYLNFPRYAFIYAVQYEFAISAAESAVYMLAYNSTNQYTSKIYTDDSDTFGQGTTYFLFISKKAFTFANIDTWGPEYPVASTSVSLDGKVTHYVLRTLSNQAGWASGYNYAYSYYDGQAFDSSKIALIGKECLYDNVIE